MKTIDQFNFSGKKVLVRVDFNVPLNEKFEISDDTRIQESAHTIKKILADGGMPIIMSHLGRPKGAQDKYSLKHVQSHVAKVMGAEVVFANNCIGEEAEHAAANLKPGQILLLENLRFHSEEEAGDEAFAKSLSKLGDIYVNDAFGTAHRAHASTAIIAKFFPEAKCFGYLMAKEIVAINKVLKDGEKPVTAIIGGSKVSSKITIILKMLDSVDNLIIGGGMAFTFEKAKGGHIGNSLCENDQLDLALDILKQAEAKGVKVYLPKDAVCADKFSNDANTMIANSNAIPEGWSGLDAGPEAIAEFAKVIKASRTILWNGPLGVFEMPKFAEGTKALGKAIGEATALGAFSLVGGGDSVAAVKQFDMQDNVSYISTGGGAMLESLEGKELPGIKAILS